jgi:hypothetical protein
MKKVKRFIRKKLFKEIIKGALILIAVLAVFFAVLDILSW